MPIPSGFRMHESGFSFRNSDDSGPYVFDGTNMKLAMRIGACDVVSSSGVMANAVAVAAMAAVPGKMNFLSGLVITATGATLGNVVSAILDGIVGGPVPFVVAAPAGILANAAPLTVRFDPPIPASSINTAISLTLPALGLGNLNAAVLLYGFRL